MEEEKSVFIDVREIALKWTTNVKYTRYYQQQVESFFLLWSKWTEISSGTFSVEINLWVVTLILKCIDCNQVKIIEVPHIEGLRIPEILTFARRHWNIDSYLPEYECEKYPSRKWIWNVGKLDD